LKVKRGQKQHKKKRGKNKKEKSSIRRCGRKWFYVMRRWEKVMHVWFWVSHDPKKHA